MKKFNLSNIEITFSEDSGELLDIITKFPTYSLSDKQSVEQLLAKNYLIRAIISGEELIEFSNKADKYTGGQYFTELFPYKFFSICQNKYLIIVEDLTLNHSLIGTVEDHIISNLNAIYA